MTRPDHDFKLSITKALADQLEDALQVPTPAPLRADALESVAKRPGIYQLFLNGEFVYVGKASKNLQGRLAKHAKKISGRAELSRSGVSFICLYVDEDLEASAPEKMLIKRYKAVGRAPWNANGFGNNDPGRRRDKSLVKSGHFDARYPVDLDVLVELPSGSHLVGDVIASLKKTLPYLLRHPNPKKVTEARRAFRDCEIRVPEEPITARDAISLVMVGLPDGWQATALPGYVILYPEDEEYGSALAYWRRSNGHLITTEGSAQFAEGEPTVDDGDDDGEAAVDDDDDETIV